MLSKRKSLSPRHEKVAMGNTFSFHLWKSSREYIMISHFSMGIVTPQLINFVMIPPTGVYLRSWRALQMCRRVASNVLKLRDIINMYVDSALEAYQYHMQ